MDWIIGGIIGWCGTGWPIRLRGGGGGLEPGDWGPPGCWVCGRIIGAIGGIVAVYVFGAQIASAGGVGTAILAFFGGSFLAEVAGAITKAATKTKRGAKR